MITAGVGKTVTLTDIYLAPQPACNIVSVKTLEQKGFWLVFEDGARSRAHRSGVTVEFNVTTKNFVLFVVMATA